MMDDFQNTNRDETPDGRSPFAVAIEWTSRISAISMEMVVPTVFGLWLDTRWHTLPLCLIIGGALGFWIALKSLLQISKQKTPDDFEPKK